MRLLIVALISLLFLSAMTACWPASLTERSLPPELYQDWATLKATVTDNTINQVWRRSLDDLPKDINGYMLISYQVEQADTPKEAAGRQRDLLNKARFNSYVSKGDTVNVFPWVCDDTQGANFSVRGHHPTPHGAEIYTIAMVKEKWVIWVEVRQSLSGKENTATERALAKNKNDGLTAANEFARLAISRWNHGNAGGEPPKTPDNPPVDPPKPPVDPPKPPVEPPVDPPKPVDPPNPPVDPPQPPVEPPVDPPKPPVVPPVDPPKPPVISMEGRWQAAEGSLSCILPPGVTVAGKAPYTFKGFPEVLVRLFPVDLFATPEVADLAIKQFVAMHKNLSKSDFVESNTVPAGCIGARVSYTNYANCASISYYFGARNKLWRLDIELPGKQPILPPSLSGMIDSFIVQ